MVYYMGVYYQGRFALNRFSVNRAWKKIVLAAVLALTVAPTQAGSAPLWAPPLGQPLRISASYSLPGGPYQAGHRGIDLFARPGDPVRMPATGTVTFVGTVVDRPVLSVRLDARTIVSFEPLVSEAREGDVIARGAVIGKVASYDPGSATHCRTGCLHLGVRIDGEYTNPLRFLRLRPRLLPW